ncbi:hypothetical protein EDD85DRAFT_958812 [Armillaria nabsnona]|nr:hypothetical protein EDD85DRAFT_958812 [Armillaria nabsnona]
MEDYAYLGVSVGSYATKSNWIAAFSIGSHGSLIANIGLYDQHVNVSCSHSQSLCISLPLPMAAVPPFLQGPGMTPEVFKCLEQLKVVYGVQMNGLMSCQANNVHLSSTITTLQVESKLLKRQNELLQEDIDQARWTELETRDKVLVLRKDKQVLMEQLAMIEKKAMGLFKQAKALAAQAHQRRLELVSTTFGKMAFIEESFIPTHVIFNEPAQIMSALPSDLMQSMCVYFLPLPPPVYASAHPQHRLGRVPVSSSHYNSQRNTSRRLYLGRYLSAPLDGENMKVSEWIKLDAQTKKAYCTTVGQTLKEQKPDQQVSCAKIQQQLDSGEYAAPYYRLQCVGYNLVLQEAFVKASTSQLSDIDASRPSQNILLSVKVVMKSLHAM